MCQGEKHSKLPYLSTWNKWILFLRKRLPGLGKLFLLSYESGPPMNSLLIFLSLCYLLHIWYPIQGRDSVLSTTRRKKHKALRNLGSHLQYYWRHTLEYQKSFRWLKMKCKNALSWTITKAERRPFVGCWAPAISKDSLE